MRPSVVREGETSLYAFRSQPTMVDFPGRMAAVFFVSGCNLACRYCHNPDLLRRHQQGLSWARLETACERFREDWTEAAVITGGEPTLARDLPELIAFFRDQGWSVKLDTNGSRPDVLAACLADVDYVAMDVKAGLDRYEDLTGFGHVERIRESITVLRDGPTDYELRTTLIASFHDDDQLRDIAELIHGARRYVLQAFVPQDGMPDPAYRELPRTSTDRLHEAAALMAGCADEVLVRGD